MKAMVINQHIVPRLTTLCYRYLPEALEKMKWSNELILPWIDLSYELQAFLMISISVKKHDYSTPIQNLIWRDSSLRACSVIVNKDTHTKVVDCFNLTDDQDNCAAHLENCEVVRLNPTKDIMAVLSPTNELTLYYDVITNKSFENSRRLFLGTSPMVWSNDGQKIALRTPDTKGVFYRNLANKTDFSYNWLTVPHKQASIKEIKWSSLGNKLLIVRENQSVDLIDIHTMRVFSQYDAVDNCTSLAADELLFAYVKKIKARFSLEVFKNEKRAVKLKLQQQPAHICWNPLENTLAVLLAGSLLLLSFDDEGYLIKKEKIPNDFGDISNFLWSPAGNCISFLAKDNVAVLCYLNERMSTIPIGLPNLKEMAWHPKGDYLWLRSDTQFYFIETIKQSLLEEAQQLTFAQAAMVCDLLYKKLSPELKSFYNILLNMALWPEAIRKLINQRMRLND